MIYVLNSGVGISTAQANAINSFIALGTTAAGSALTKDAGGNFVNTVIAGSGSVSTVSVISANGFAGTVATPTTTPAITLTTSITGVLKGNGTAISAAADGTDYLSSTTGVTLSQGSAQTIGTTTNRVLKMWATDLTVTNAITGSITGNAATVTTNANLTGDVTSVGNATTVGKINGTALSGLATGILKNTTTTGVPSIAVAGDFPTLNQSTTGTASAFTGNLTGEVTSTGMATTVTNAAVIGKVITGFVSGSGAVAATDTILQAINKLDGNIALKAPIASPTFTGTVALGTSPTMTTPAITGLPTGTGIASAATASTLAARDSNGNLTAVNLINGFFSQVLGSGSLLITSKAIEVFTGTAAGTMTLPTTNIVAGHSYTLVNQSTGLLTVQSSGANIITTLGLNQQTILTALIATPTTAAHWSSVKSNINANANGKRVLAVTQSATPAMDTDNGDIFQITGIAQAITSMTTSLTGTPAEGDMIEVQFTDNGTARAIAWGASFANGGLVNLPTTTVISTMLRVLLQRTGSVWSCIGTS